MNKKLSDKIKEGVSVEEIEKFSRKYLPEIFLIVSIIIATISAAFGFFMVPGWSLFFAGLGAIIGIALPDQVGKFLKKMLKIQSKADKSTIVIVGVVRLIVAIFIPFIIFAEMGLLAGYAFHSTTKEMIGFEKKEPPKNKEEEPKEEELKEEEHI